MSIMKIGQSQCLNAFKSLVFLALRTSMGTASCAGIPEQAMAEFESVRMTEHLDIKAFPEYLEGYNVEWNSLYVLRQGIIERIRYLDGAISMCAVHWMKPDGTPDERQLLFHSSKDPLHPQFFEMESDFDTLCKYDTWMRKCSGRKLKPSAKAVSKSNVNLPAAASDASYAQGQRPKCSHAVRFYDWLQRQNCSFKVDKRTRVDDPIEIGCAIQIYSKPSKKRVRLGKGFILNFRWNDRAKSKGVGTMALDSDQILGYRKPKDDMSRCSWKRVGFRFNRNEYPSIQLAGAISHRSDIHKLVR